MIRKELSDKIRIASFICTIMVLYRHSLNYLAFFDSWTGFGINNSVQGSIMRLTEIAVPYFFIISGFFFFSKSYYSNKYIEMIEKKIKTLVIPFLFWNIICILPIWIFDKDKLGTSLLSVISNLTMSNWNGPLWYIRDLIIFMALVPLYNWIIMINKWWLYAPIMVSLFYFWIPVDTNLLSTEGILFFLIGGILAQNNKIINRQLNKWLLSCIIITWICLSVNIIEISNIYIHKINTILGIISFWNLLNYMPQWSKLQFISLSSYSFIIYAMHFYPEKIIKRGIAICFKGNEIIALITYIAVPLITAFLIIAVAKLWKRYSINTYNIVTGNR